jgi:hypothetical protein
MPTTPGTIPGPPPFADGEEAFILTEDRGWTTARWSDLGKAFFDVLSGERYYPDQVICWLPPGTGGTLTPSQ